MRDDLNVLKALGQTVRAPMAYNPSILDAFGNRHSGRDYWVTFTAPEFTTLSMQFCDIRLESSPSAP